MRPTLIFVHGGFAESAIWDFIDPPLAAGHAVIAAAKPLRGLAVDAAAVSDLDPHRQRANRPASGPQPRDTGTG